MNESKIELTERLRREGRWPEASKFKDAAVKDFRDKGMKRQERLRRPGMRCLRPFHLWLCQTWPTLLEAMTKTMS